MLVVHSAMAAAGVIALTYSAYHEPAGFRRLVDPISPALRYLVSQRSPQGRSYDCDVKRVALWLLTAGVGARTSAFSGLDSRYVQRRSPFEVRPRSWASAALLAIVLASISGCSQSQDGAGECMPGRLSTDKDSVVAGGSITVTSAAVDCDIFFTNDGWYTLGLGVEGGGERELRVRAAPDGAFTTTIEIPEDMPSGGAYVAIRSGYEVECSDTGSCAMVLARFHIADNQ